MNPSDAQAALEAMRAGDASNEVFEVIVAAAEGFAALEPEWMFESPQTGLFYVSRNDMLIETMCAAKPEARLLLRLAPPYPATQTEGETP